MTELKQKVTNALNETRMLVLGAQILVGFGFQSVFRDGFAQLSRPAKWLDGVALFLMVCVVALLIAPAAFHRIVENGRDTERLHAYTSRCAAAALLPFALSLGLALFVALEHLVGAALAATLGLFCAAMALFLWYGIEFAARARRTGGTDMLRRTSSGDGKTPLAQRINHMLTEARVVLPGAQALLGFQLIIILAPAFERLPDDAKVVHVASLALIALSVILLMTPAAYHRLVYEGEDSEEFHRLGSRLVLLATLPLALGISGDLFVVIGKIAGANAPGIIVAVAALLVFAGLWYVYPFLRRSRTRSGDGEAAVPANGGGRPLDRNPRGVLGEE